MLKGSKYSKALYLELLALLYDILAKVRKEGLMSIEADVDNPEQSPIFTKYPRILADHHAMEFLTDYLRLMVGRQPERLRDREPDGQRDRDPSPRGRDPGGRDGEAGRRRCRRSASSRP